MPELPEVETIRRGLQARLPGRRIEGVDWRGAKLRGGASPRPLAEMEGQRVTRVRRHGKFLLVDLGDGLWLVHLGMTGKLLFAQAGDPERRHTHLVLALDDGTELRFSDPRRFGVLKLFPKGAEAADLAHFGPDALSRSFTPKALAAGLASSASPLKAFLLDQGRLAGVGNIYACEALWRAGLSPRRKANTTPPGKVALLHGSIQAVLRDSLAAGGTSFNDYVDHIGQPGRFLLHLAVYDREGRPCPRCQAAVKRITQSGRSTFYCPKCQK
ncbi:MAG TPA: bifunctional DNA-formamidopyrimidine glycosylase/DNA-(apurinic or apyrimidinic site) lyase [Candidatus Thermoplasmatota archaeon]|nr:bifunctional DNA-formamidopyrimidine glycosylase/DNA-(apurinic or apyrimidinic site) lyase [Candidatus Thermoplasmatota archaeon]